MCHCFALRFACHARSVNTRVGNELGAGNAEAAKLSVYTAVVMVALVQSVLAVACKLADRQVVGLLSNNKEVEELTISTMPILLPTFVCEYPSSSVCCNEAHGLVQGGGGRAAHACTVLCFQDAACLCASPGSDSLSKFGRLHRLWCVYALGSLMLVGGCRGWLLMQDEVQSTPHCVTNMTSILGLGAVTSVIIRASSIRTKEDLCDHRSCWQAETRVIH